MTAVQTAARRRELGGQRPPTALLQRRPSPHENHSCAPAHRRRVARRCGGARRRFGHRQVALAHRGRAVHGNGGKRHHTCAADDLAPRVSWGDGATTDGEAIATEQDTFDIRAGHTYADEGEYGIAVTVKECATGGIETGSATARVASAALIPVKDTISDTGSMVVSAAAPPPPAPRHGFVVVGADRRHAPRVRLRDAITGKLRSSFVAYSRGFHGGVRVAIGDVDGDGIGDIITAPGRGTSAHVRVFSGASGQLLRSFLAFDPSLRNGAFVAAGDVDGDARADVIVGAGAGPRVKVFDGANGQLRSSFLAYGATSEAGVRVGAGDVDGDGRADIVAGPGRGASPHVKVFSGANGATLRSFMAYGPSFSRGVFVAAGDVDGDSRADIVVGPGRGASPHVKVFSGANGAALMSFFPYDASFTGGVRVAAGDADGDRRADVITSGGRHVRVFGGASASALSGFHAGPPTAGPVFVAGGR